MITLLAGICFAAFGWGMQFHFVRGNRFTTGMLAVTLFGSLSAVVHLAGLMFHPGGSGEFAAAMYFASLALFAWAIRTTRNKALAACYLGQVANSVVTEGPYRWIRHPFYTAYSLAWLGGCCATLWWPTLVTSILMLCLYVKAAKTEEHDWLGSPLWTDYAVYMRQTGGLLPRIKSVRVRSSR